MTTKRGKLFIEDELEYLETRLEELKQYIDENPYNKVADRFAWKETKSGGAIPIVISTKEVQRKDITQALKDYVELLNAVNTLRSIEENKVKVRGGQELSGKAERWLNKK